MCADGNKREGDAKVYIAYCIQQRERERGTRTARLQLLTLQYMAAAPALFLRLHAPVTPFPPRGNTLLLFFFSSSSSSYHCSPRTYTYHNISVYRRYNGAVCVIHCRARKGYAFLSVSVYGVLHYSTMGPPRRKEEEDGAFLFAALGQPIRIAPKRKMRGKVGP